MALTTDRISVLRGRPPMRAGGRRGFRTAHCWLVRSLGYGFGFIPFLRSRPPFGTDSYLAPVTSSYLAAPDNMTTTLTQQDLNELIVGLSEEDERLKGEKTAASERKAQLITKAWEMIAEKRAVEVDDLEAIDKQLGRRLVDLVMKNPSGGSGGLQVLPAGSAPSGILSRPAGTVCSWLRPLLSMQLLPKISLRNQRARR